MTTLEGAIALGASTLTRVVGHGADDAEALRARARVLDTVTHPAVARPLEVRHDPSGEVIATWARVDGVDLETVLRLRGALSAGECVWVGTAVALALASLHKSGLAHGDVSPANIMIGTSVTLVDTLAGAMPGESGTPGYAAPERALGASAPSDVYSLGRILREAVRPEDAELIGAWVDPLLHPDPGVRPTAAMTARALPACAPAMRVDVPAVDVAHTVRAVARPDAPMTVRKPEARWWRWRRAAMRISALLTVVAAVAAGSLWAARTWGPLAPQPVVVNVDPSMPIPAWAAISPADGARDLVERRFAAVSAGDADALRATVSEGSPAATDLEPLAGALESGQMSVAGLTAAVEAVTVLAQTGSEATVEVSTVIGPHTVSDGSGARAFASYVERVEMDVRWSRETGWVAVRVRVMETQLLDGDGRDESEGAEVSPQR